MKKTLPTTQFFIPITRSEEMEDHTLVEGYAYVNAKVASDRYNLTRGAMEAASKPYMQFPAVREMHQSSAAGTGTGLEWDERGVKLATKIVDPIAREKVRQQVYRGFSVGVNPKVVRGNDVISCEWIETSLVDRPADPEAVFTMVRTADLPHETEVEVIERKMFVDYMGEQEPHQMRARALGWLGDSIYDIQTGDHDDREAMVRDTCDQFKEHMVSAVAKQQMTPAKPLEWADVPELARSEGLRPLETEVTRLTQTISALEIEREEATKAREALTRRVAELEAMPGPTKPVARFAAAIERQFVQLAAEREQDATKQAELERLLGLSAGQIAQMSPEDRASAVDRIGVLKQQLSRS